MIKKHKIQPTEDRVVITAEAGEEKTSGGIIIPQDAKEKPQIGHIVAVGPGTKEKPMLLKAGDRVLYGKYSGAEIKFDGIDYLILRSSDVLATLQ